MGFSLSTANRHIPVFRLSRGMMHPQIWIFRVFRPSFCCCWAYIHWNNNNNNRCQFELFPPNWFSLYVDTYCMAAQGVNCSSCVSGIARWKALLRNRRSEWFKLAENIPKTPQESGFNEKSVCIFCCAFPWDWTQIIIILVDGGILRWEEICVREAIRFFFGVLLLLLLVLLTNRFLFASSLSFSISP